MDEPAIRLKSELSALFSRAFGALSFHRPEPLALSFFHGWKHGPDERT
jgi:hypothetical protein